MAATREDIIPLFLARKDIDINGQSRHKETPLYQAIQRDRLPVAQMLLDAGADPNVSNWEDQTPLGWAAGAGKEEAIELLLKQPSTNINHVQKSGQPPLSRASENGHAKCARLLLAKGASVETADKEGNTPLSLAAAKGHKVLAKLLLKHNADINAQDKKGNTPLAAAVANGHDAVVRFLLESGADAELADEDEETPFEKARDGRMEGIVAVFGEVMQLKKGG